MMNPRFTIKLCLALVSTLVGCGQLSVTPEAGTPQISSADLLSDLTDLSSAQQQALFTSVASLSIPRYFAVMLANASDAPVMIDGITFNLAKTHLLAQAQAFAALANTYPTIGALRAAYGERSGMPTLADVEAELHPQGHSLGLVSMGASTCKPSVPGTWTAVPPNSNSIAGKNAIEFAGVNYSQVGTALKRYQAEADRQKIGWEEFMGKGNLAVQTGNSLGRPVIVTGKPTATGPTSIKALDANGKPSIDITDAAFACYEQTPAGETAAD